MSKANYILLTPLALLQNFGFAKRLPAQAGEWRIATSLSGRSASPIEGSTYSVHALREVLLNAKVLRGIIFSKLGILAKKN